MSVPTTTPIVDTIQLIAAFVRNVGLQRALLATDNNPHLNFWRVLQGNCMDMAAIDWCKLFGNDDKATQPSHWKNVVPVAQHDAFRDGMLRATGLTQARWKSYRESIVEYRNKMAAHLDDPGKRPKQYPTFDEALLAAAFYFNHIMNDAVTRARYPHYPDDLMQYERDFREQGAEVAKLAMAATAPFPERVR